MGMAGGQAGAGRKGAFTEKRQLAKKGSKAKLERKEEETVHCTPAF